MRENKDQKNSKYKHFLRSDNLEDVSSVDGLGTGFGTGFNIFT